MAPRKGDAAVLTLLILEIGLGANDADDIGAPNVQVLTLLILEIGLGENVCSSWSRRYYFAVLTLLILEIGLGVGRVVDLGIDTDKVLTLLILEIGLGVLTDTQSRTSGNGRS